MTTFSFLLTDKTEAHLAALANDAFADLSAQLAEQGIEPLDVEEIEMEIIDAGGQYTPANSVLIEIFGKEGFELLLMEEWPAEEYESWLEAGGRDTPTASVVLYHLIKVELSARVKELAAAAIDERLSNLSPGKPGRASRPSGLAGDSNAGDSA